MDVAETSTTDDSFAARLNLALKALNFSRGQLSAAVGVDKSLVSRWLSGQVKPTGHNLARISEVLAKLKPGFNMTLWERPLPEFEAFLGIDQPVAATADAGIESAGPIVVEPPRTPDPKWIVIGGLAGLAVIAAVAMFWLTASADHSAPARNTAPQQTAAEPAPPANSIGVLPFVNMSGDAANDYFSDGISEEILNELANTPNLRVVGRTSSFAFKGTRAGIAEIGRKLHVRVVLEGSVREDGNRVRITAQLVDAANGFHIWSQTYDRDLGDVLKVQSEIARAIAGALTQKIAAADAGAPQIDPAAYRKFLQGKFAFERRDEAGIQTAIRLFREVVAAEPKFAEAYAMLAYAYLGSRYDAAGHGPEVAAAARAESDAAAEKALALDPDNMTALYVSLHRALLSEDWERAMRFSGQLNAANPHHILSVRARSFLDGVFGYNRDAVAETENAARLDPLSYAVWSNLTAEYYDVGRYQDSIDAAQTTDTIQPGRAGDLFYGCVSNLALKRYDEARRLAARLETTDEGRPIVGCRIRLDVLDGKVAEARQLADKAAVLASKERTPPLYVADGYMFAGDNHDAAVWLEREQERPDPLVYALAYDRHIPRAFMQSAEWHAFTQQPRFVAWMAAREKYGAQLAQAAAP